MSQNVTIEFDEGETHEVIFAVPRSINMALYQASLQVRRDFGSTLLMGFATNASPPTIDKIGQSLKVTFRPLDSVGRAGNYKWQLVLTASPTEVIKFPARNLIINRAIHD